MKRHLTYFLAFAAAIAATAYSGQAAEETTVPATPKPAELRGKAREVLGILPLNMPGGEKDTPQLIELGRRLFFEKRLSINQTQSCNSCHAVDAGHAGVDGQKTSEGALGKRGGRNSPTVLNAGFHFTQFWDGRALTLEEQAKGPILNPIEMGMPNAKEVMARIGAIKEYQTLFAKAFPAEKEKVTYDNLAKAIAAFERTLVTRDRFDDFLRGLDRALSPLEQQGLTTFLEIGCTTCHNGALMGGNSFQKVGLINAFENTNDVGRVTLTKDESDTFKFKVPSLRNVALTGPYFHDGSCAQLQEVVTKMAWMQLGRKLTEAETKSIVAFLQSLSDKDRGAKSTQRASTR